MTLSRLKQDLNSLRSIALSLTSQIAWSRIQPKRFHSRTQNGQEVDIVLEDPTGRLAGIEVKSASLVGPEDFRGLRALAEAAGRPFHRGIVLYTGTDMVSFGQNIHAVPVSALWNWGTKS